MNTAPNFVITYRTARASGHFEMDADRCTRLCIVTDIIEGQYEGIDRIFALEHALPSGGHFTDVTEQIATEVADRLYNEREPVNHVLANWLHGRHPQGVLSTRGMLAA